MGWIGSGFTLAGGLVVNNILQEMGGRPASVWNEVDPAVPARLTRLHGRFQRHG
jgi:hypothetical protein